MLSQIQERTWLIKERRSLEKKEINFIVDIHMNKILILFIA